MVQTVRGLRVGPVTVGHSGMRRYWLNPERPGFNSLNERGPSSTPGTFAGSQPALRRREREHQEDAGLDRLKSSPPMRRVAPPRPPPPTPPAPDRVVVTTNTPFSVA